MMYAVAILGGYLIGSIPFGLILTRLGGYGDIRAIGSGNIGATNVLRTGNKKLALATLILDGLKGVAAVLLANYILTNILSPDCATMSCIEGQPCECTYYGQYGPMLYIYLAGFFAILGHLFPVWLKFKGGKGVATTLGTLLAIKPIVGIAACGIWLLTAIITRYSSLSALVAIAAAPVIVYFLYHDLNFAGLCAIIAALVFVKHRANIKRLIAGEEPKIGQKK